MMGPRSSGVPNSKVTHNAIDKYRIELIVDDGTVEELKKLNGWE